MRICHNKDMYIGLGIRGRVPPNYGLHEDILIFGCILGSPYFGKLPSPRQRRRTKTPKASM